MEGGWGEWVSESGRGHACCQKQTGDAVFLIFLLAVQGAKTHPDTTRMVWRQTQNVPKSRQTYEFAHFCQRNSSSKLVWGRRWLRLQSPHTAAT